jgi:malate dehydrogenase
VPTTPCETQRPRVTIVGAGEVGTLVAAELARRGDTEVRLLSETAGLAAGRALDIRQAGPILGAEMPLTAIDSYDDSAGSVVVVTTSIPYGLGPLGTISSKANRARVAHAAHRFALTSPDSVIVVVTNPVEAMCAAAHDGSGFERHRVLGMAGDTARLTLFLAEELAASVDEVETTVIGGHGDTAVALIGRTTIRGIPVQTLVPPARLAEIIRRAQRAGVEITELLGRETPSFAPAMAAAAMVDAITLDRKQVFPAVVRLDGEYGLRGLYAGVPSRFGRRGVDAIIEVELTHEETLGSTTYVRSS